MSSIVMVSHFSFHFHDIFFPTRYLFTPTDNFNAQNFEKYCGTQRRRRRRILGAAGAKGLGLPPKGRRREVAPSQALEGRFAVTLGVTLQPLCSHFAVTSGVTLGPLCGSLCSHFAATSGVTLGTFGATSQPLWGALWSSSLGSICSHFGAYFAVTAQPLRRSLRSHKEALI